eukprot:568610-Alexandrium_andersonii.AAC.1
MLSPREHCRPPLQLRLRGALNPSGAGPPSTVAPSALISRSVLLLMPAAEWSSFPAAPRRLQLLGARSLPRSGT